VLFKLSPGTTTIINRKRPDMNTRHEFRQVRHSLPAVIAAVIGLTGVGSSSAWGDDHRHMTLHSATFADGGTLPLSMINTIADATGQNTCTVNGAAGGNESPQLSWRHAPPDTRSFVVIAYDITAQFTHWQMYNIPADTTSLPQGAGIPGSVYGVQNGNDFFVAQYSGPCPPTTLNPHSHIYRFTVYALDRFLPVVQTFGDFTPAGPEGLYQELIEASREGHVLASASIAGHFSAASN
jgi:Raf kinase inhibitor-like YbhB/YbcL family protein